MLLGSYIIESQFSIDQRKIYGLKESRLLSRHSAGQPVLGVGTERRKTRSNQMKVLQFVTYSSRGEDSHERAKTGRKCRELVPSSARLCYPGAYSLNIQAKEIHK